MIRLTLSRLADQKTAAHRGHERPEIRDERHLVAKIDPHELPVSRATLAEVALAELFSKWDGEIKNTLKVGRSGVCLQWTPGSVGSASFCCVGIRPKTHTYAEGNAVAQCLPMMQSVK